MIARCHRPTAQSYKNYGARGITVCDRWRNSFEAFWADMGPTYRPGLSIERKENDLGYSPDNCMWADRKTQCRNRRTTVRVLTPNGVMPLTDASERYGVRSDTLMWRIKAGWPTQRIFQK